MAQKITCKSCSGNNIIKKGIKRRKMQQTQRYLCKDCNTIFTLQQIKNKTYPIELILKAISTYNLGYNLKQTQQNLERKQKIKIPISTISSWINEHKETCTFSRLRKQAIKLYNPKNIIKKQALSHIQPYAFKCHKAKLYILINENPKFEALMAYLEKINSKEFPNHIFNYNKNNNNGQRASQLKFNHLKINQIQKQNKANELAKLALNLSNSNKERHQAIQDFFLINDSTTIAAEVPVYLTNWDAGYYKHQEGFIFPLSNYQTPITGHIDILQIRNGLIHILDYKPEADKINPVEQLTIYALALSRKLNLPLYYFKTAWFDEDDYFEFFPLHAVYKLKKNKRISKYQQKLKMAER